MTACNLRPPEGHPWHGTLVACHLATGHEAPHSWEIPERVEPWAARLVGGPAAGDVDRTFFVPPIWSEIRVAPFQSPTRGEHWEIVGGSELDIPDRVPMPREARYLLVEVAEACDGSLQWIAFYRWAREPSTFPPDSPDDSRRYWGD
jgi:hypothetical protein